MGQYQHTFDTYNQLANAYQDKFMDLDLYDDSYDQFCKRINKTEPAIFEIGCGPGNITRYLLSKIPAAKITAIDMAPNMLELAARNNPAASFLLMDAREINLINEKFDAVMCGFCMPYLSKEDCIKLIKDCADLLHSGGIFYSSIIEDDYNSSGIETSSNGQHSMFVYRHQADYLTAALAENNFTAIEVIRKEYPKAGNVVDVHTVFIAEKV
jgi:ubiquinone/menaquinone biosynthesis C-methylase UbiE